VFTLMRSDLRMDSELIIYERERERLLLHIPGAQCLH